MKILFLTNNSNTAALIEWLKETAGEDVVVLDRPLTPKDFKQLMPDWIISFNYRHLVKEDVLILHPDRFINLHTGYLPWNRGVYPNLWSFLEDTPKGITIHFMEKRVDAGAIILQKKVTFDEEKHSLASSYNVLHEEIQTLFKKNWAKIKKGAFLAQPMPKGGSHHSIKDFLAIEHLLDEEKWDVLIVEIKKRYQEYLKKNAAKNKR